MFSDNNNYMRRIDEIEQKMIHLNERIPLVFQPVMNKGERTEWINKISICLSYFEKKSQFLNKKQKNEPSDTLYFQKSIDGAVVYLASKPEKSLNPLLERLDRIRSFRKDILSSALLAASFYGMEELHMRLPRLEEILRNPFDTDEKAEAISGMILIADGGPAEGAKVIQLYLDLNKRGVDANDPSVIRMLGLLGILANRPMELASEIMEETAYIKTLPQYQELTGRERFLYACGLCIENMIKSSERREQLNPTARNLLEGMSQEVAAVVAGCLMK